ncbi:MAG: bifunctional DNA primase/polymerase [Candidatus Gastranaerophilales bacterium]|nr:bifunctional DNA primase/polymerase [Candidatus Gastranaerophilales bacterium]
MQQKIIKLLNNFAIFPCKENSKIPNTPHGFKDGKKNVDVTTLTSNGFNVGVSCQLSNIIVLDCDIDSERGLNGIETIKNLEKELSLLTYQTLKNTLI